MPKPRTVEDQYTVAEMAEKLRVHPNWIYGQLKPGAIWPVVKLSPRTYRVKASVFQRFLDSRTVGLGSDEKVNT